MSLPVTVVALFPASLTKEVAQFLTLKFSASFPALASFCLPAAFDTFIALFAFVLVGNSSGFESIFERFHVRLHVHSKPKS